MLQIKGTLTLITFVSVISLVLVHIMHILIQVQMSSDTVNPSNKFLFNFNLVKFVRLCFHSVYIL